MKTKLRIISSDETPLSVQVIDLETGQHITNRIRAITIRIEPNELNKVQIEFIPTEIDVVAVCDCEAKTL